MNNENLFSRQNLIDAGISPEFLNKYFSEQLSSKNDFLIDQIFAYISKLRKILDQVQRAALNPINKQSAFSIKNNLMEKGKDGIDIQQAILLSGFIITRLRELLTEQEFSLSLAREFNDNNNGLLYKEKNYSFAELSHQIPTLGKTKALLVDAVSGAIIINEELFKMVNTDSYPADISSLWNKICNLVYTYAEKQGEPARDSITIKTWRKGKKKARAVYYRTYYLKNRPWEHLYVRKHLKKQIYDIYYNENGQASLNSFKYISRDRGFLNQHFQSILYSHNQNLINSIVSEVQNNSLETFFKGYRLDNISSEKGGDFSFQNQTIQAKFGYESTKAHFMTFNIIYKTLLQIETSLKFSKDLSIPALGLVNIFYDSNDDTGFSNEIKTKIMQNTIQLFKEKGQIIS